MTGPALLEELGHLGDVPAEAADEITVDAPHVYIDHLGVHDELSDVVYHADPVRGGSLSSSGARKLLPPSCPARFAWDLTHPTPYKKHFDFGHAAHRLVLGAGAGIVSVDADNWRTNKAKDTAAEARAAGKTPLLRDDYQIVKDMAAALRSHPIAADLLDPDYGQPEKSLFWIDEQTGVTRRARLDWMRDFVTAGGRYVIPDYKTAASAARDDFEKAAYNNGYVQQAPWYEDAVRGCQLADDAVMVFVVQEKTAPYLVNVIELTTIAGEYGRDQNRQALAIYAKCVETGRWPGYSDDIEMISLPGWVEHKYLESKS